jgi:hypothetical protein
MGAVIAHGGRSVFRNLERSWPLDARMAMFVLEAEGALEHEGRTRELERFVCRVGARLKPMNDARLGMLDVFIRDVSAEHAGFISSHAVDVGASCWIDFVPAEGAPVRTVCTVGRCREFMNGWFEGVIHLQPVHDVQVAERELRLAV